MGTVYGRGSEWRRWDLHIHTPGTARADQFGEWDEFVAAVEAADPSVAVVGVTDYASINTYKIFKQYHDAKRMRNIVCALPNIEFRVSPETKAGKGINLHLLVSPDDPEHVERIEEALGRLKVKRQEVDIPCSRAGLIRLGRLTDAKLAASPDAAYREGVNQFKVDLDGFREWFQDEQWLSRNALVAVAAGSNDGASGLTDSGYLTTRREIYRFAHIIFSGKGLLNNNVYKYARRHHGVRRLMDCADEWCSSTRPETGGASDAAPASPTGQSSALFHSLWCQARL
jgi:hypothetical protein